jgi:hypothetical protein
MPMVDESKVELKVMIIEKRMLVVEKVDLMLKYYLFFVEIIMANHSKVLVLNYSVLEIEV